MYCWKEKATLLDFDLYICERFGNRNSLHVTPTQNGYCVGVNIKPVKLYIRFWEYSNGVGGFPDWCIILVHCNFTKEQEQELQELVRLFKKYAPRYDNKYIGIENNSMLQKLLKFIHTNNRQENYAAILASL